MPRGNPSFTEVLLRARELSVVFMGFANFSFGKLLYGIKQTRLGPRFRQFQNLVHSQSQQSEHEMRHDLPCAPHAKAQCEDCFDSLCLGTTYRLLRAAHNVAENSIDFKRFICFGINRAGAGEQARCPATRGLAVDQGQPMPAVLREEQLFVAER